MAGRDREFDEFAHAAWPKLHRSAYLLTGDHHLAEDLAQTALADAYRHWRKVSAADDPGAYVRRMLVNAHLSWRRRRSSTERPTDLPDTAVDTAAAPGDALAARDHMRALLAGLAPRARTVLVLRYYADLDDAAIAEAMGVSASSVRATASRALAGLRATAVVETVQEAP
jgi:RNA polymerase sigma-70 factor (sigma-E family)